MALSLAAVLPLLGLPVFFRTDDVHWLGWAIGHDNPLAALEPGENLFGYYRPVPTVIWWGLYRLFGFEPLGYQLVLGAVGVLAMVPLFRIGRRVAGGQWGGLAAVALFHLAFVNILYFYFWYSALTFALEVLLHPARARCLLRRAGPAGQAVAVSGAGAAGRAGQAAGAARDPGRDPARTAAPVRSARPRGGSGRPESAWRPSP